MKRPDVFTIDLDLVLKHPNIIPLLLQIFFLRHTELARKCGSAHATNTANAPSTISMSMISPLPIQAFSSAATPGAGDTSQLQAGRPRELLQPPRELSLQRRERPAPAEEKCVGSQMEASLQSLPELLRRLCSQMEAPPQSLHWFLIRLCSQMEAPLHELLRRLCSQMEVPPQSLHRSLRFLCSQMLLPPQSTH